MDAATMTARRGSEVGSAGDGRRRPECGYLPELFSVDRWQALGERLGLSPRQLSAAHLLCRGCSTDQIAAALDIAPDTAGLHLRKLFEKLNVHDRVGVVVRLVLAGQEIDERHRGHRGGQV